jgi:transposase InsO family protein
MDATTCRLLLEIRRRHPDWGAGKLLKRLHKLDPKRALPADSTVGDLLRRENLIVPRRRRRRLEHPGRPTTRAMKPNDLWTADFKGQFKTRDGVYCYPLTVADAASRFVFACRGLSSTKHREARPVFLRLFQEFGLPCAIRTDNGTPFATTARGRLSRLSVWWIKLGVRPELIEPGHPEQNGIHERMHRTLGRTTDRPARDRASQQREFREFLKVFNYERPHDALHGDTPAEIYQPSARPYPTKISGPEYPGHYEVRRVSRNGGIRWCHDWVNISSVLAEEHIGFEEVDDGIWTVWFCEYALGRFDERRRIVFGNRDPDGYSRR